MSGGPGGLLRDVIEAPGPWRHRSVAANGARFHLAEAGRGPLVLLLHGFPEFWWAWRHQLGALAAAGYRAAAMDLRGYGGSDKPPRGYDPVTLASDVAGVVRSLGERSAVLVGHGWGAHLAWAAAVLRPAEVRALASLSMPHPLVLRRSLVRDPRQVRAARHLLGVQIPMLPERRLVAHDAAYVGEILRRWSAPAGAFPDPDTERRYRDVMRLWPAPHCSLEYHRWAVRSLARADGRRFARRMATPVPVPVLQVHGKLDPTVLARTAARSRRYVQGPYRWVLIDGVGHFPHEEAPDRVSSELVDWLRSLPA